MGDTYRVIVQRIPDPLESDDETQNVIELLASREQLARFAPGVVAEALGTMSSGPVPPQAQVAEQVAEAGPVFTEETAPGGGKRRRRTKAEMDAARAAEQETATGAVAGDAAQVVEQVAVEVGAPVPAPPVEPFNPFAPK